MLSNKLVFIAAMAAGLAACAHDPSRGTLPNGERLYVNVGEQQYDVAEQVSDGTAVHRDANGNVIGTSEMSHTEWRTMRVKVWSFHQGKLQLDELDFFRLAGDDAAVRELSARRSRGMVINRVGLGLALAGVAGMVGQVWGPDSTKGLSATVWAIGLPVGGISAFWGKRMVEGRYFSLDRAMEAAGQGGPGTDVVGSAE